MLPRASFLIRFRSPVQRVRAELGCDPRSAGSSETDGIRKPLWRNELMESRGRLLLRPGPHLRTVVAHEYTHAVTFSRKALADPARGAVGPEEEGWLDEALAHLGEDLHGFSRSNIDYRISAFLSNPERYRMAALNVAGSPEARYAAVKSSSVNEKRCSLAWFTRAPGVNAS